MINRVSAGIAACLLCAVSANGAEVSASFNITDARLPVLYSGTLDPACTPTTAGSFFNCTLASVGPASITINPSAGGGGTIDLKYDDATGEVTEITRFDIFVSDMAININAAVSGDVTIVGGNGFPVANDIPYARAGTAGANGTADEDQNALVNVFQHDAPGTEEDAPNFAAFTDITDTCVGTACSLLGVLDINALRYEIIGSVVGDAYNGGLRAETKNNSNYFIDFTSTIAPIPVPAAVWLFGSALGLLGWVRRRAA